MGHICPDLSNLVVVWHRIPNLPHIDNVGQDMQYGANVATSDHTWPLVDMRCYYRPFEDTFIHS